MPGAGAVWCGSVPLGLLLPSVQMAELLHVWMLMAPMDTASFLVHVNFFAYYSGSYEGLSKHP